MPLPRILQKASTFILGQQSDKRQIPFADGEVIYCKNNVCVHPPTLLRQECDIVHHPGYLMVHCQQSSENGKLTLQLTWIPNTTLRKNPQTLENRISLLCVREGENVSGKEESTSNGNSGVSSAGEFCRQNSSDSIESHSSICSNSFQVTVGSKLGHSILESSDLERNLKKLELDNNTKQDENNSIEQAEANLVCESLTENTNKLPEETVSRDLSEASKDQNVGLPLPIEHLSDEIKSQTFGPMIKILSSQEQSRDTSPTPSHSSTCSMSAPLLYATGNGDEIPTWMSSPELLALQHNLTFPESITASPIVRRAHRCRRFSVDLSQMRSLRLFFNDSDCTCGQLVVASRESQYKILHFHHGGLDHLANVLEEWNFLLHSPQPSEDGLPCRHFMVCRPEVNEEELHPEEGLGKPVDEAVWNGMLNEFGQVEDDLVLRKEIFFGGIDTNMRQTIWPFLLYLFPFQTTYEEREHILVTRRQEYDEIMRRRLEMEPEIQQNFWRNVQCVVEKDVVRTDRGNPYFAGDDNPHIETMKNILLNYAVYNPGFGYTQGMSDLLAPVLAEIQNESDTFWCFVGLMQKAIFVCTPTDNDMDKNLNYLRELIKLMLPDFYNHLQKHADAMELLFCHRWILLCFKREFPEPVALKMWEACWANYLTDYFHLFLCLAIICIYSDDVIAQDLRTDEMLLHFSSLAMYMDGELILRKARGLLHQFRQMPRIPCTLGGLCQLCGPGMWDSTHVPVTECNEELCPHKIVY